MWDEFPNRGLAIVKIDERRMTIPKEVGIKGDKAIVILAGTFLLQFHYQQNHMNMQVHGFHQNVKEEN